MLRRVHRHGQTDAGSESVSRAVEEVDPSPEFVSCLFQLVVHAYQTVLASFQEHPFKKFVSTYGVLVECLPFRYVLL